MQRNHTQIIGYYYIFIFVNGTNLIFIKMVKLQNVTGNFFFFSSKSILITYQIIENKINIDYL